MALFLLALSVLTLGGWTGRAAAEGATLRYFPVGPIYEFRWKVLELALSKTERTQGHVVLVPFAEEVTQNRGIQLLQSGAIDVVALGTNADREEELLPIKFDILRGVVGFRLLIIRAADQAKIAGMDDTALRRQLTFGLNSQWADLPVMRANGFSVVTSPGYENLFGMLAAGRFDAFPRGLNEARHEMDARRDVFPQLAVEGTKAFYFPFPIYFWVRKTNLALSQRNEHGLQLAMADGSYRKLFMDYHAADVAALRREKRHIIRLDNPVLPTGTGQPDTSWWWPETSDARH
jgi:hypothetical protein